MAARREDGSVVDLSGLGAAYQHPDLMAVLAEGPTEWARMRAAVDRAPLADPGAAPLLPVVPGDFTDFYACRHHVERLGRLLRPGQPPVPPAWPHVPLGYTGRASTVVVSGTTVARPAGMRSGEPPTFGPSTRLDVEVELGFVVGVGSEIGTSVPAAEAEAHLFGVVVLNDWSARDIQAFETFPLGPHIGKSFATSISPWVVPLDVVPRCRPAPTGADPARYLAGDPLGGVDVDLVLRVDGEERATVSSRHLAWTPAQLYAQVTVGGAATRPGDILGSGTISGPEPGSEGSLIEAGGPYLADGQTATIHSPQLGTVEGRIAPCRTTVL
ncbi:fumarylacetoacetate hydrolase family protein [Acidiferrimicrobium sp. IK]|uniref:fumarylacetoacetate hydrolase family protein n=1 Tax=Acidiferrimicrobium sp. IK TaxID=2871700 RepID=UPI0021CB699D|nr:fumarylacetoacetate hydrolase family protein [Acidiferrimicrobium sp. IK]MCU4185402.1 fumarylacetoacetate hydrolase family protein [Acidiferrimicrobium sp. IK]